MKKIYFIGALMATCFTSNAQVVISQVYGGGGNGGATYTHDFIELFNRGSVAQSLNGWSVQYNSAAGTGTWSIKTDLPNVILQPGQYFLIQEATNAAVGAALPTPDLNGISAASTNPATGIAMSGSNGKIVLANSTVFVTGANPVDAQVVDKVGFGATPTGFEGTGPTGTALTSTTAVIRNSAGCSDTDSNPTDFTVVTPAPRNTATALNLCSLSVAENNISGLKVYPNPAKTVLNVTSNSFEVKQVELYDVLGKLVLSTKVTNAPVNVSALSKGVYVVKVTEAGKSDTRKIVIE